MNVESSRSHAVLTLRVQAVSEGADGLQRMRTSRLHLVDLAGSERQKDSGAALIRLARACLTSLPPRTLPVSPSAGSALTR